MTYLATVSFESDTAALARRASGSAATATSAGGAQGTDWRRSGRRTPPGATPRPSLARTAGLTLAA